MKSWFVGVLAALYLASASQAECTKQLQIVSRIPLTAAANLRALYVPVEINGQHKRMLIDTGADFSVINAKAAAEMGLPLSDSSVRLYDITGTATERMTTAELKLGKVKISRAEFMVSNTFDHLGEPDVIGLLGANVLSLFDVSLDVPGRTLDLLSQDHCPDQVIYWSASARATIPFQSQSGVGHILIPAKLDDKPISVVLDTGAWNSTLHLKMAQAEFAIVPGTADTPVAGMLNGNKDLPTYSHVFKTLDFDGVAVTSPKIVLIPDRLTKQMTYTPTGSRLGTTSEAVKAPMLLGMNVLRHLHIYIAYKDRMIYLTPSEEKPAEQKTNSN